VSQEFQFSGLELGRGFAIVEQGDGTMENHSMKRSDESASAFTARMTEAGQAVGSHASDAFEEVQAAGKGLMRDYGRIASGEKKRIKKAVRNATAFARENSFVMAGGALVVGLLLGHVMTRRAD
jgi:ElaB/YqjD/DUF883 family membrane-anchored ribosome-binding protein